MRHLQPRLFKPVKRACLENTSIHGHLSCRGTPALFVPVQPSINEYKGLFHRNVLNGLENNKTRKYNKLYRPLWMNTSLWPSVYQPPRLAWN